METQLSLIDEFRSVIDDFNESGLNLRYETGQNKLILFDVTEHHKDVLSAYLIERFGASFNDVAHKDRTGDDYSFQFWNNYLLIN